VAPASATPRPGLAIRARRALKRLLERLVGVRIYSVGPHGRDDCTDIRAAGEPIELIVDVGANVGQSALKFRAAFPRAFIHCVEPAHATFRALAGNLAADPGVACHRVALGGESGQATLWLTAHSTTSSLLKPADPVGRETVELRTLDELAAALGIAQVDLLKVDAEGADLDVLEGAAGLLRAGRVRFVLVEVGFDPGSPAHVLFDHVRDFLLVHGFALFGLYDQTLEWSGEKRLRFANACFRYQREVRRADALESAQVRAKR
jgi:FkbM family methyltransferase